MASKYYKKRRYSRYNKKKGYSRNYKKKYYKKKGFTKHQKKIIKAITYKTTNNPRNKEIKQVVSPFYINNCCNLYQPDVPPLYNGYEFQLGNFKFYPLTCLGGLDEAVKMLPRNSLMNLKNTYFITRWVNNNAPEINNDRTGYIDGLRFSIHSIQLKGYFEMDNHNGFAKPTKLGVRILRQYKQDYKDRFTTYADGVDRSAIPSVTKVYKNISGNFGIQNQDDLDKLHYAYLKDNGFNKKYQTVLSKYVNFNNIDLTVPHKRKDFNVITKFKYPLEVRYDNSAVVQDDTFNRYYMSLTNNLYLCPYFSTVDDDNVPTADSKFIDGDTNHPISDACTYRICAQLVINYSDA